MKYPVALALLLGGACALADDMDDRVRAALEQDSSTAITIALNREAQQGNLKAAHELGLIYLEGRHVGRDPERARALFEMAGQRILYRHRYKLGYAESQFELGRMIEMGMGDDDDSDSAAEWYERAAEQGHARAQAALARLYLDESASPQSFDDAYMWAMLAVNASYGLSETERAEARRIMETAGGRLAPSEIRSLKRKVANWSPRLFAGAD